MSEENVGLMQRTEEADVRTMVAAVKNRLAAVRELMKSELRGPTKDNPEGVDYGVVPGTKKKTLLQPGAQKIALMFGFVPSYQIERTDMPGGHRECHTVCTLSAAATGRIIGQGSGSASTMETKHRYRGASGKECPKCGAMACKASKKEYGGGYWCDQKAGGCGEKFKPQSDECKALDELPTMKTENPDPADQWNTVEKMSNKRAFVAAVLTASAAGDIFTQDLEDAPPGEQSKPPVEMPKAKEGHAPAADPDLQDGQKIVTGTVESVSVKDGTGAKGPWKKYGVKVGEEYYATFNAKLGTLAESLTGQEVEIIYTTNAKGYHDIAGLRAAKQAEPGDNQTAEGDGDESEKAEKAALLGKIIPLRASKGLTFKKALSTLGLPADADIATMSIDALNELLALLKA